MREAADRVGERPGLAGAEQEADGQERPVALGRAGERGEGGPPQHDARQHPARAHHVAEPSRWHFEERVGEGEGAEHQAHLHQREPEVVHHVRRGNRDADAIEEGDDGEQERHPQHAIAHPRAGGRSMGMKAAIIARRPSDPQRGHRVPPASGSTPRKNSSQGLVVFRRARQVAGGQRLAVGLRVFRPARRPKPEAGSRKPQPCGTDGPAMNVEMLIAPHVRGMQPYAPIVPLDVLSRRLGLPAGPDRQARCEREPVRHVAAGARGAGALARAAHLSRPRSDGAARGARARSSACRWSTSCAAPAATR